MTRLKHGGAAIEGDRIMPTCEYTFDNGTVCANKRAQKSLYCALHQRVIDAVSQNNISTTRYMERNDSAKLNYGFKLLGGTEE